MDKLIEQISCDLNILPYIGEAYDGFCQRILYSSFGIWCLSYANRMIENQKGISKNALTRKVSALIDSYLKLFPNTQNYFKGNNSVGLKIKQIYEELGYLVLEDQRLKIAPFGRGLKLDNEHYMYYGLPNDFEYMSGLAIVTDRAKYEDSITNVLVRDEINPIAYVKSNFDPIYFNKWESVVDDLLFFDPLHSGNISSSWKDEPTTELSIAKNDQLNVFYKVICKDGKILYYSNEKNVSDKVSIFGYDYRRLYYSLKYFYGNPFTIKIKEVDEYYIRFNTYGRFPNREQYFLSLIGWGLSDFDSRDAYIVRKDFYKVIKEAMLKIGIITEED